MNVVLYCGRGVGYFEYYEVSPKRAVVQKFLKIAYNLSGAIRSALFCVVCSNKLFFTFKNILI